jgi:hypothetical protein
MLPGGLFPILGVVKGKDALPRLDSARHGLGVAAMTVILLKFPHELAQLFPFEILEQKLSSDNS